ncbi:MAG: MFS transporter [Rhodocyclaceae bacterium]|nr:MFS transporter [Rhodocyclaceae bacterium]
MTRPVTVSSQARRLLLGRALRAFCDGYVAILLPAYLLSLGMGAWETGLIGAATLFGSATLTLALGQWGWRFDSRRLLLGASLLMAATGLLLARLEDFWPLLVVAFVGTINPSSGDVSIFLPLEQARLSAAATGNERTRLFSRYTFLGAVASSLGALVAVLPEQWAHWGISRKEALQLLFLAYGCVGFVLFLLYRGLPAASGNKSPTTPLGPSRALVLKLAWLFALDAFAGGLIVNALLAFWLFMRFGLSLSAAGAFFFWSGLLSAFSQLAAAKVAERIGLVNTMVFTHLPANVALILAAAAPTLEWALGFLLFRALLSQMDVPTRSAYVMAVVTPPERAAAASFTSVPRSLAAAASPALSGALMAAGWLTLPLILCGALKIAYDLSLWRSFRAIAPRH